MNLKFLGTLGDIKEGNQKHRKYSSLLIDKDDFSVLIDWGGEYKDDVLSGVDVILLTHAHSDCCGGLLEKGVEKPVYFSDKTAKTLKEVFLGNTHIFKQKEVEVFEVGPFEITTFPMLHTKKAPMTGFKIRDEDNVVVYAPETLWIPNRDTILKDVDIYIGDCSFLSESKVLKDDETGEESGHASVKAQLSWLEKAGIKKAIFTHLGEEIVNLPDKELNKQIKDLSKEKGIEVLVAEDGMNISASVLVGLERVVHPDEQLFRAMAELLQVKEIKPSDVSYDVEHPKTRWKELIVDLWYLGNTGYLKLKKGMKWGDWTIDLCLKYFAKAVDSLRSVYFPIVPPQEGDRIFNTAYWRCYREAEDFMDSQPPEDVEEWDKKRPIILKPKKKVLEAEPEAGIYFAQPHARYIVNGDKKAIIKSRKFTKYMNEPLYLLSKSFCFGIIKYTEPREIDIKEFKELQDIHKVTDRERIKWWGERAMFYFYPLEIIEIFDEPKRYKRKVGVQTFQTPVEFLERNRQDLADGRFVLREHGWEEAKHFDFVLNLEEGKLREYHIWKKNPLQMSKGEKALGDNEKICPHLESFTFEGEVEPDVKGWKGLFNPTKDMVAYVKILDRGTVDVIESKSGFKSWAVHGKKMKGMWTWNKTDDKYYFGRSKTAVQEDEDYLSKRKEG